MSQRTKEQQGRRVAVRTGRTGRSTTTGIVATMSVVAPLVFGLLAWVGAEATPTPPPGVPAVQRVAVDAVSLLCPTAGARGEVLAARPDLGIGQSADLTVRSGRPDDLGDTFGLPLGGTARPAPAAGPLALLAAGSGAPGVFAEVVAESESGPVAATCVPPGTSWWFPGAGAGVDRRSALTLTNLEQGPAVVDVRLHGLEGPLPVDALRGVTIEPGTTRTWAWADVVPGQEDLTVEVRVVRGRVAATAREEGTGVEWHASAAPPATRQQVPVVPAGPGPRVLTVTNPGESPTRATVRVVTTTGAFVPLEQGELLVEPGAVAALDLTEAIGGEVTAVEVTADAAVVAGVRASLGRIDDAVTVPATSPLDQPGAAGVGPGRSVLHLSAGDTGVAARVSAVAADGEVLAEQRLATGRSTLVGWPVPQRAAYVVVVPTRGAPYAAVVRGIGTRGVTVVPVAALPLDRAVPRVVPQPAS